jgi:hypothetical protein
VRHINTVLSSVFIVSSLVSCSGSESNSESAVGGSTANGGATVNATSNGGTVAGTSTPSQVGGSNPTSSSGTVSANGGSVGQGGASTVVQQTGTSTGGKSTIGSGGAGKGGTTAVGGAGKGGTTAGKGGTTSVGGAGKGGTTSVGGAGKGGTTSVGGAGTGGSKAGTGGSSTGGTTTVTCSTPFKFKAPFMDGSIYTADPSAHVFDGKVYVYPSHDLADNPPEDDKAHHFNMADYHVYSTDLTCWPVKDHGEILNVKNVAWAKEQMWAPDAAYKNNKYYFYFPARAKSDDKFHIGVATSTSPTGPFTAEANFITNSTSIDPAVFVDDDGSAYMYFGGKQAGELPDSATGPRMAKMSDDMLSFNGAVTDLKISGASTDNSNYFEGPWVHKYKGTYYLSYSTGPTHILAYATSSSPTGPFTYKGTLLNAVTSGWTTHASVIEFNSKWYLFYADSTCSNGVTQRRCVKVQELKYNTDGSIIALNP